MLSAIVFGLGGSARTASRGSSNKGFIRTGQASAQVTPRICYRFYFLSTLGAGAAGEQGGARVPA